MLPDRVSNPRSLTYELGALPIALRGPALSHETVITLNLIIRYNWRLENQFRFQSPSHNF